jgi:hypothetical protein
MMRCSAAVAVAAALLAVSAAAQPPAEPTTWDGRHPIGRIAATIVYFVPADRVPLPDWRSRAEWYARRIEAFHAREFEGRSVLTATVVAEPLVSRLPTAALRAGDANAIFFRTLGEADERLSFARERRGDAFPVLVVLSDINWRPLDDFQRLAPTPTGFRFEGSLAPEDPSAGAVHVPGAAAGGARATYLADAGKGWGLVSGDGWRVPYRGSDCVVYHEGVGHAIGLPHPPADDANVMSFGQYRATLGQSWVDPDQKKTLGWEPVAGFDAARHALFSGLTGAVEPATPRPGQPVTLRLGLPAHLPVTDVRVEIQTALRGPWLSIPVPATAVRDGAIPLGGFDRPCPVAWRARLRRATPIGTADDAAELWGYFQVRTDPGMPPPAVDIDPLDSAEFPAVAAGDRPATDLLAAVDPTRDAVAGEWTLMPAGAEGGVRLTAPKAFGARLELPTIPPEEYRLTVIAEPLDEPDGLILGQRAGDSRFVVLLGFTPQEEQIGALENVDGGNVAAPANPTRFVAELFARGRPATIEVVVRSGGVRVDVDGRTRIDWRGDAGSLSLSDYWTTPHAERLFLGAYDCRWRFHRATIEPLGEVGPQRADSR